MNKYSIFTIIKILGSTNMTNKLHIFYIITFISLQYKINFTRYISLICRLKLLFIKFLFTQCQLCVVINQFFFEVHVNLLIY